MKLGHGFELQGTENENVLLIVDESGTAKITLKPGVDVVQLLEAIKKNMKSLNEKNLIPGRRYGVKSDPVILNVPYFAR